MNLEQVKTSLNAPVYTYNSSCKKLASLVTGVAIGALLIGFGTYCLGNEYLLSSVYARICIISGVTIGSSATLFYIRNISKNSLKTFTFSSPEKNEFQQSTPSPLSRSSSARNLRRELLENSSNHSAPQTHEVELEDQLTDVLVEHDFWINQLSTDITKAKIGVESLQKEVNGLRKKLGIQEEVSIGPNISRIKEPVSSLSTSTSPQETNTQVISDPIDCTSVQKQSIGMNSDQTNKIHELMDIRNNADEMQNTLNDRGEYLIERLKYLLTERAELQRKIQNSSLLQKIRIKFRELI